MASCGREATAAEAGAEAERLFESGLSCAESVVLALARRQGIESDLLPAIATGFCAGVARTGGMCGAVSGAVMAIGLANGRRRAGDNHEANYACVQALVAAFATDFGSTACPELLGVDIGAAEGRQAFRERGLIERCHGYTRRAAELAAEIIAQGAVTSGRPDGASA